MFEGFTLEYVDVGDVTLRVRHGADIRAYLAALVVSRPEHKPAARVMNGDPDGWYRTPAPAEIGEDNHADVWAALRDPGVVHGMCEDHRAGLRIDRAHEEADRAAHRRIACPMLLLAATEDDIDIHGDPEEIWRPWVAGKLRSAPIHSGHHQAEQAPNELAKALIEFVAYE